MIERKIFKNIFLFLLKNNSWFHGLLILVCGGGLYFKTIFYGLTYYDDVYWLNDFQLASRTWTDLGQVFCSHDLVTPIFYRPLLNLTFIFNSWGGGASPLIYHLTNLIIHLVNGVLVYLFFLQLKKEKFLSLAAAMIFTAHPVLTQAVVWIPGRTDSFFALFALLSFLFFVKFVDEGKKRWVALHFLCFIAALLSKETAVVIPVVCMLYAWMISRSKTFLSYWGWWLGWGVIFLGLFCIRKHVLNPGDPLLFMIGQMFKNFPMLFSYLGKIIFPCHLAVVPVVQDLPLRYGVAGGLVLSALLVFSKEKRMRYILFGVFWFLGFLAPSFAAGKSFPEYRVYLSLVGLLVVVMEVDWVKIYLGRKVGAPGISGVAGPVVALVTTAILGSMSFQYARVFKDKDVFWESAVQSSPHSSMAHLNLGAMYYMAGRKDEAESEFLQALENNPYETMVHCNLGLIYMGKGLIVEAEQEFLKELQINPGYTNAYYNLGVLYYRQNKFPEAEALWKKTLEIYPLHMEAARSLAGFYFLNKNYEQSAYYVRQLKNRGVPYPPQLDEVFQKIPQ